MNWTVGPHPSSVYWRRRVVLFAPALLVLLVLASCLITRGSGDTDRLAGVPRSSSPAPDPSSTPADPGESGAGSAALGGTPLPDQTGVAPAPSAGGAVPSPTDNSEICTDSELTVTAIASDGTIRIGEFPPLNVVIRNSSSRACVRDVGANEQELRITSGSQKVWSSDDCTRGDAGEASVVRRINPGERLVYFIKWGGNSSAPGCTTGAAVKPGKYQLTARLGTLQSKPAPFQLTN